MMDHPASIHLIHLPDHPVSSRLRSKAIQKDDVLSDISDEDVADSSTATLSGQLYCHGCFIKKSGVYRPLDESNKVPCFCQHPFVLSVPHAISQCAHTLHISYELLSEWVTNFYLTGDLVFEYRKQVERPIVLAHQRTVTPEMIIELYAFMKDQVTKRIPVNIKTMQTHLRSNVRLHDLVTIDSLPPCDVSLSSIKDAMAKCLGLKWG